MRCFAAVDIDDALKGKITELQKQIPGDVKPVESENLHFTLKFLGEIDEKTIEHVKGILRGIAVRFKAFDAEIKGTGVFPNENYTRVVWLGCRQLTELQNTVEDALAHLFKKENLSPHLTLVRVRSARGVNDIMDFVAMNRDVEIGKMHVDRIKLKKSNLSPKGPTYDDITVFELGSE